MKERLNIREIARRAGVSPISVSRALLSTPSKKVSESTRSKILKLCEELHYHPNEHFRRITTCRANTVAFIFHELAPDVPGNGGFEAYADLNLSGCIRGAQEFLAKHDIDLLLMEATPHFLESKRYIKMIRGGLLDGILLWGMTDDTEWIRELPDEDIPVVVLQTESTQLGCDTVIADDYSAMSSLVERALESGHRKFAVISAPFTNSIAKNRYAGMDETLKKHGIRSFVNIPSPSADLADGYAAASEILEKAPEATCAVSIFEAPAYGIIAGLKDAGINIPQDISVIAGGGLRLPGIVTNLSSYSYNSKLMGQTAAEILLRNISGSQKPERILVPAIPVEGDTFSTAVNKPRKVFKPLISTNHTLTRRRMS